MNRLNHHHFISHLWNWFENLRWLETNLSNDTMMKIKPMKLLEMKIYCIIFEENLISISIALQFTGL